MDEAVEADSVEVKREGGGQEDNELLLEGGLASSNKSA